MTADAARPYTYLSPPDIGDAERAFVASAFGSNWIAPAGPDIAAFERETAAVVGAARGVAVSSGTAALHLILMCLGVEAGDRVVAPSFTFAATVNPVCYLGAEPVLLDCDEATWTIDPALLEAELAESARHGRLPTAVITVDLYGQCADYAAIVELCDRYGVFLIEDAAEALGSSYRGRQAATFGRAAALSFNGNKIVTTGGGGMVVTDDDGLADRVEYLSTQARDPVRHYEHRAVGYNYRLSNVLAALGRGQLLGLPDKVRARQAHYEFYRERLGGVPGITMMPLADYGVSNCWLTCILIDPAEFGATRDEVADFLEEHRIESRPVWKPLHLQPVFARCERRGGAVGERLYSAGLCLPSGSGLTAERRAEIADLVLATPRKAAFASAASSASSASAASAASAASNGGSAW